MPATVRLGLVGAGRWGRNYIRTIAGLEGVRLAAVASRNPGTAALLPADCRQVADWRELLEERLDGLIVATPPALHAAMAQAAVERGVPVLVEKPLALDVAEARALRELVAARGGLVRIDHTHLYNAPWRALKAAAPRYGEVAAIEAAAGALGPFRRDTPVLWDWGSHDIALCIDLLGAPPAHCAARVLERRETAEGLGECLELTAQFAAGVQARLVLGNLLPRTRRFEVRLQRGTLVYDDLAVEKLVARGPGPGDGAQALPWSGDLPLACAVREFAAAIARGERSVAELELGVAVVETLARFEAALA